MKQMEMGAKTDCGCFILYFTDGLAVGIINNTNINVRIVPQYQAHQVLGDSLPCRRLLHSILLCLPAFNLAPFVNP